jgi:hypothetical protein
LTQHCAGLATPSFLKTRCDDRDSGRRISSFDIESIGEQTWYDWRKGRALEASRNKWDLGNHSSNAMVNGRCTKRGTARHAAAPECNLGLVNLVEWCGIIESIKIVPNLEGRVNFESRESIAFSEVAIIVNENIPALFLEPVRKIAEIMLLKATKLWLS